MSRGSGVLRARSADTRADRESFRFAGRIRRSAGRSLALGGAATTVAVCAGLVLFGPARSGRSWNGRRTGDGQSAGPVRTARRAHPDTVAQIPPRSRPRWRPRRRCRRFRRTCRRRSPPPPRQADGLPRRMCPVMEGGWSGRVRIRRPRVGHHRGIHRGLACSDVEPGARTCCRTAALEAGDAEQGHVSIDGSAHRQPLPWAGVHRMRAVAKRHPGRLQNERPQLIVLGTASVRRRLRVHLV